MHASDVPGTHDRDPDRLGSSLERHVTLLAEVTGA
jgi:hypothetical protein